MAVKVGCHAQCHITAISCLCPTVATTYAIEPRRQIDVSDQLVADALCSAATEPGRLAYMTGRYGTLYVVPVLLWVLQRLIWGFAIVKVAPTLRVSFFGVKK